MLCYFDDFLRSYLYFNACVLLLIGTFIMSLHFHIQSIVQTVERFNFQCDWYKIKLEIMTLVILPIALFKSQNALSAG